jgi:hypothetical protein
MILNIWILLGILILFLHLKSPINILQAIAFQYYFIVLGVILLKSEGSASSIALWLQAYAFFVILFFSIILRKLDSLEERPTANHTPYHPSAIITINILIGIFTFYHLIKIGIPIFSTSIEISRFNISSSGLYGIPGRMYLFGVMFGWIVATINARWRKVRLTRDFAWWISMVNIIGSSLLSGFKGELVNYLVLMICCSGLISRHYQFTIIDMVRRYWGISLIALSYFFWVAGKYNSYKNTDRSLPLQMFDRLTKRAAEPGVFVIDQLTHSPYVRSIGDDFQYFLSKYSASSTPDLVPFEKIVATKIYGWDHLINSSFYAPVTIGIAPEMLYFLGIATAFAIIPAICFLLFQTLKMTRGGLLRCSAVCILAIYAYKIILKGDFVYHTINYVVIYSLLFFLTYGLNIIFNTFSKVDDRKR